MSYDPDRCPDCSRSGVARSPTGWWCNACGWASPGYECEHCGRTGVNEEHTDLGDGRPCRTELRRPGDI